jgi:predicted peroxiredoxin
MARLLIHVTRGADDPDRTALAFLIAHCAIRDGHAVSLFLAGDAVELLRDEVLDGLQGFGTGKLREHYAAIAAGGGRFHLSGDLAELSRQHDRVLTY